jgi:hypothetical protein
MLKAEEKGNIQVSQYWAHMSDFGTKINYNLIKYRKQMIVDESQLIIISNINSIVCCFNTQIHTGIAEVLDLKGLKKGMNKTGHTKDLLTQEGNDKTHIERATRMMNNWQSFIFLTKLYTKKEDT